VNIPDPPWVQDLNNRAAKIEKDLDSTIRNVQLSDEHLHEKIDDLDNRLMFVERYQLRTSAPPRSSDSIPKHVIEDWIEELWEIASDDRSSKYWPGIQHAATQLKHRLDNYEA
jgi:hypothetical protein